jgi:hypothetical protein
MHVAAESIPVAEKWGAMSASIALKISLYKQAGNVMINYDKNVKDGSHGLVMILLWKDFRELGIQFFSLDINWVTALNTNEILTQSDNLLSRYV